VVHHLVAGAGPAERAPGLRHVADAAAYLLGLLDDVVPGHRRGALGRSQQRGEHPEGGGLARAVGAEEADHLALGDIEVDAVDGADLGLRPTLSGLEGLHQTSCTNHVSSPLPAAGSTGVFKLE
jgi:hypothetical protein